MKTEKKKKYVKPGIAYREKIEVLAIVCNSAWARTVTCRLQGSAECVKTRL